ncbi:aminotransferase class IV family protein [Rhizobium lentis]|uniref:Branched-subunit amino acid aminotransferase/4-amino-4-deoxychorismate lyase n=1 Tax=Rhizobium lentis TaxID=1138194 RepID=A0A7W8XKU3_9HYPH|nr:aminotransferase class IV family protein [Rhizobium lentis]MBB4577415.1 branched-subunit amino acid aminotransferase/4-amino-4-deoxychorismate lyase [Rhizobium lentis]MBB5554036.1 branched-subunit amino acid aminotransferase/4-amino-4-deoxychorismate lyase [Rhizobium lentis]MBB5564604.1 branched-subunit amino acid aminotransferase/4-amino-4-deoxychorismate lyase [Rhizobium lentis]MBB5571148.1 branched-subunit amino acid aminotransferase/4-amino-4-deoxychorismate lyase [Rhizobium lentis]
MSPSPSSFVVERNGRMATADDLAPLAFAGYAHFTAMQVREGKIRGLNLHLERLRGASVELFGWALPDDRVRSYLRAALEGGPADLSLLATVYSPAGEFTVAGSDVEPEVLVRTGPAASGPKGPLALAAVEYERTIPAVKHVGEVAKTYFLRQAVRQGFDDAAFVDRTGKLSEGTIWNLAFWDGAAVVWPAADVLLGTTMSIVRRQLDRLGVSQRIRDVTRDELSTFAGAAVMNSWTPGVPVHRIGSVSLPEAPSFLEVLHRAYHSEPLVTP